MNEFQCRQCNKVYPNQEEYFTKSSRYESGFDTLCKACKSKKNKAYRENNSQSISDRRKSKYDRDVKPISHELYAYSISSDPISWRAKILRQGMQQRSVLDNLDFDAEYFTIDRIKGVITEKNYCPCCKRVYCYGSLLDGKKNPLAPSADRFDSNSGYTRNNVVFICWRCNNLKRDTTIQDLQIVVSWLEKIIDDE